MFASLPDLVGAIAVEDLNVGEDRAEEVLALHGEGGSDWPEGLKYSDRGENGPPLKGNKEILTANLLFLLSVLPAWLQLVCKPLVSPQTGFSIGA